MARLKILILNQTLRWWASTYRAGNPRTRTILIAAAVAAAVVAFSYAPDLLDYVVGDE